MGAQLQSSNSRTGIAGSRSRAYRPMAEINVTPFVDVMLVLLIVFMITAPLLTSGVPVDLPRSEAKQLNEEDSKPIEISITKEGKIFMGESQIKWENLTSLLTSMTRHDPDRRIFIRGDKDLNYGMVMELLGDLNASGFKKVALITDPSR